MRRLAPILLLALWALPAESQEHADVEASRKKLALAPGLQVTLWASDPLLANPVAISIDEKGRVYVAECWRRHTSTLDIHMRKEWLDDDLACRRHEDQIAYHERRLGDKAKDWKIESERIRILEDKSGKGVADSAVTFSDGYHDLCEGIGAGILVRNGEVWYTCIPTLWYLKDTDGDGVADVRKALHTGFGVHLGASGHDMHGLRFGPDGKLYWSHGDRGFHVEAEGRTVSFPDGGGVLRCNPDGSELEIVCVGLRNPQELQFDQYGNLFTGDNNISKAPDVGETCRWTYIVEGADYGWRIGYQFMDTGGAWCGEDQWKLEAGFQVPFVARLGHGPSGVTYHPGVAAIPERYKNHFFMCDYPGGVWSFEMKPKGASFEMVDLEKFVWELQAPDVEFAPDGTMLIADWVGMWDKVDKGRLWRVSDPHRLRDPAVLEVKKLIEDGMKTRSVEELSRLLGHADQRVRQAAQFELVGRKEAGVLSNLTDRSWPQLVRLHSMWGLGQLKAKDALLPLLGDADPEIRAQAAKVLGGLRTVLAYDRFLALLQDESPRVRFFAAMGIGKIGKRDALGPVVDFLRANNNVDRMLQHAGIMALTGIDDVDGLRTAGTDPSAAVRMAALVAMRKLKRAEVGRFLTDADPKIVLEAARAVYDVPIDAAMPALRELLKSPAAPERALIRAVNAAFRAGDAESLAAFAARSDAPSAARVEALEVLGDWEKPSGRDRLMGLWRPIPERSADDAVNSVSGRLKVYLLDPAEGVSMAAARLAGRYKLQGAAALLSEAFRDRNAPPATRAAALRALAALNEDLGTAVGAALQEKDEILVREGVRLLPQSRMADAPARLEGLLAGEAPVSVRQAAILALGELGADASLEKLFERGVSPALQLELLEAAGKRPALKRRLAAAEAARKADDPLSPYRESLEGGDVATGRRIFFERAEVQCVRCHGVGDQGGQVGPPLTKIGAEKSREYLLESILFPNKQIAEGWGQVAVQLQNDRIEIGRVAKESDAFLMLVLPDGNRLAIAKSDIKARKAALSAMPEDLAKSLSKRDLRDLVEYLSSLR
ncbi:MAG TPA: PVC-type heme-binding CxxCH protein [Planctomycetota bacterium]|nr:PVC-type heme-binding CxxCH protein [Planctomycetota bacterium]